MFVEFLPKQLHVSKTDLDPKEFIKAIEQDFRYPKNDINNSLICKPHGYGLWTSSWLGEPNFSDWIMWCNSQHFGPNVWQGFLLDAKENARIFKVDNLRDYIYLRDNYTTNSSFINSKELEGFHWRIFDFEQMSQDIDAVFLTENGERETKFPLLAALNSGDQDLKNLIGRDYMGMNGWDCESTLWLNPKYQNLEYIGEIRAKFYE